jgi:hypothetical protein
METERTELVAIEAAVAACNAVAVPDPVRVALVRDLGPVANRLAKYAAATSMTVTNEAEAEEASQICTAIAADIATVKNHEVLSKITSGLHDLHRRWTGLRDLFVAPMTRDRKTIKDKVIAWQEAEKRKAEEIQRKLQAEADAKAAREREKQEAEACRQRQIEEDARRKAEDARRAAAEADGKERARLEAAANAADRAANAAAVKAEARVEAAASVIAPTIHIEAPKSGMRSQGMVTCEIVSITEFIRAAAARPDLCGYIDQESLAAALKKARIANSMFEAPGVKFGRKTV